jgi:hypothetical protein
LASIKGEGDGAAEEEDGNPSKHENGDIDGAPVIYGKEAEGCC